jgi:hypothetical protein
VSESRSGEQQAFVERFEAIVSERYGASGGPTAEVATSNVREARERAYYLVGISNETDLNFTVVIGYWLTGDDPQDPRLIEKDLPAGEVVPFQLSPPRQCASLLAYVMVGVRDGQVAFRSPEEGAWTPERVSEEFPADQDPCTDVWTIG